MNEDPQQPVNNPVAPAPVETPAARTRKLFPLAAIIAVVVLALIGVTIVATRHHTTTPSTITGGGTYANVTHLDVNHLPDGKTTFFQMMKHTNLQSLITVTHSTGYVDKNNQRVMRELDFLLGTYTWKNNQRADYSYQTLPAEPGAQLRRCVHGKASVKDAILIMGRGNDEWHGDTDNGLGDACTDPTAADIDGVFLTGGLNAKQVDTWIKAILAIKDTKGITPKLIFDKPTVIDYNGKKVVQVVVTVNSLYDGYCAGDGPADYCGAGSITAAFDSTKINADKNGYLPLLSGHDPAATYKARYYIDPTTNLPIYVRNQDITNTKASYKDSDVQELGPRIEASEIQYTEPNWSAVSKDTLSPSAQQLRDLYDSTSIQ